MLNVINPTYAAHLKLKELMALLVPVYTSEFPVDAKYCESAVYFTDSRHPHDNPEYIDDKEILGSVEWDIEKQSFCVRSNRIRIAGRKPQHGTAKIRKYKRTKSLKGAVKLLLEYCKPFAANELMAAVGGNPRSDIAQWMLNCGRELNNLTDTVARSVLLEEVTYLVTQGVQFKTDTFRRIARQGLELDEERRRREHARDSSIVAFTFTQPDGRVSCTFIQGKDLSDVQTVVEYPNEDAMPSVMQDKIAMLRFAGVDVFVPEVGRRLHKAFWLILSAAEAQAARNHA